VRLYHVTDRESAQKALAEGFHDSEVLHDDAEICIGVWLSDRCLEGEDDVGPRQGPLPDHAVIVELDDDVVEAYERPAPEKPYREFCVPAALVNEAGRDVVPIVDVELNLRRRAGEPLSEP
jgi:hypothetical protein